MRNLKTFLFVSALGALPALALAQALTPDSGSEALISGIISAIAHGQIGLGIILALMLVIAFVRKTIVPKEHFLQGDIGGTALNFVGVALIMLAGPAAAGTAITAALVKTAILTAFATSGGFTTIKRLVLYPLFIKYADEIDATVGKVPVVGLVLKPIVHYFLGKYLTPADEKTAVVAQTSAPLQAAPVPAVAPAPGTNYVAGGGSDPSTPTDG